MLTTLQVTLLGLAVASAGAVRHASSTDTNLQVKAVQCKGLPYASPFSANDDRLFLDAQGTLQVMNADTLVLEKSATIDSYALTPVNSSFGIAFQATGSVLNPTGLDQVNVDLTTFTISAPVKLSLPNATTVESTTLIDDDTILIAYANCFMCNPNALSTYSISERRITATSQTFQVDSLTPGYPVVLNHMAYFWAEPALTQVNLKTMEAINLTVPLVPDHPFFSPAIHVSTGVLAYLHTANNITSLVQVDLTTEKLLSITPLKTPTKSDNTLYWMDPMPIGDSFAVPFGFWDRVELFTVPVSSITSPQDSPAPVSGSLTVGLMLSPEVPPFSVGNHLYLFGLDPQLPSPNPPKVLCPNKSSSGFDYVLIEAV